MKINLTLQIIFIIIDNFDYVNFRGIEFVKELNWMLVSVRRDYFTEVLMFKCIHGLAPDYLCNEVTMQIEVATRNTRNF